MSDRIFEISSYFNMKHIFCKCNKMDFVKDKYEEFEFNSDDDDRFPWRESSEKNQKKMG